MYSIADYDARYKPINKSGGELINPDYVKLPVNPKGDGLQAVLESKRGLEVFGIWCLLLEKTTAQKPETRGKLLNFKDEPATIPDLAKSISLKGKEGLVRYAVNLLVSVGWLISDDESEQSSEEFRKRPPKLKLNLTKVKVKEKIKHLDFVFLTKEEINKLNQRYGEQPIRKLIGNLNRYIGQSGKQYKSHYFTLLNFATRDGLPELKPPKEDAAAEQKAREKARQKIRECAIGLRLKRMATEELKDILISKDMLIKHEYLTLHWLIKEILVEKGN